MIPYIEAIRDDLPSSFDLMATSIIIYPVYDLKKVNCR